MMTDPFARIGLLWRQNASAETERARLQPIFTALAELHVDAVAVLYSDDTVAAVRDQLLRLDGVLVWVDPLSYGQDRATLDALLVEVAAQGVWVSARPEVILKMGTKEVLYSTRDLGWGSDTALYRTASELGAEFPTRLASRGPRVLKQYRGNGGQGVWKVEMLTDSEGAAGLGTAGTLSPSTWVRVLEARRNSLEEELPLGEFMERCTGYVAREGRLIDQPFQIRLPEGMIRCYLSQGAVIGFAHQLIRGLMPAPAGSDVSAVAQPGPRIMQPASARGFEVLRTLMESDLVPAMCQRLDLDETSLPVLWDADFLLGPKTPSGQDTYVLCEINASCITPFPEFAAGQIALNAVRGVIASKRPYS